MTNTCKCSKTIFDLAIIGAGPAGLSAGFHTVVFGDPHQQSQQALELNGNYVRINRDGETNVPGIYAAGDITGGIAKQVIVSAGDGARATIIAIDYIKKIGVSEAKLKTTQWGGKKKKKEEKKIMVENKERNQLYNYIQIDSGFAAEYDRYTEDKEIIAELKKISPKGKLVTISAHWCPDCRRNVPRMARVSENLEEWHIIVEDRDEEGVREKYGVRKIPSFIIFDENEKELGRIVENPKYGTLEEDLVRIVSGEY